MILHLADFSVLLDIDQKADLTPNSPKHGSILRPLLFLRYNIDGLTQI